MTMESVVVRYRHYARYGLPMLALCTVAGVVEYWADPESPWYLLVCVGVVLAATCFVLGTRKCTFSKTGISDITLKKGRIYRWDQVIQAGVTNVLDREESGPYLLLTFLGGKPKTRTMGYVDWKNNNNGTCLFVPYNDDLRIVVQKYYGPLDFDLSDGRSEQSIVID